ncbi:Helix-turn-helix domain protein [compost metagenome]
MVAIRYINKLLHRKEMITVKFNIISHAPARPLTVSEALLVAYEQSKKVEELERQLTELLSNGEYPEILRPAEVAKLMRVSSSKVSEWTRDPSFPVLNKRRNKGEIICVRKSELFDWLKSGSNTRFENEPVAQ